MISIDKDFESLIPPLSDDEYRQLENKIVGEGFDKDRYGSIITWNGTIIDGHNRYMICQKHNIEYHTQEMAFNTKDDVRVWIIENQIARRNIPDYVRYELVQYKKDILLSKGREKQKQTIGGYKHDPSVLSIIDRTENHDTREILSDELKWSTGKIAQADVVHKKATDEQKEQLRKGETSLNKVYQDIRRQEKGKIIESRKQQIEQTLKSDLKCQPVVYEADVNDFINEIRLADIVITDPPYSTDIKDIYNFVDKWLNDLLSMAKKHLFVCIGAYPNEVEAYLSFALPDQILIWEYKNTLGNNPSNRYKQNYQMILHYNIHNADLNFDVTNEQWAVHSINAPDGRIGDRYHAWQKPIELAERLIRHSSNENDLIVDPFCGTGTFLLAASKLGREAIGCDISRDNLNIAIQRGCVDGGRL